MDREPFEGADRPRYPDMPGHRNVQTSIAAAEAVAPKQGRLQRMTLEAIASRGPFGLTADECAGTLALDRYSIQPRTSELRRKGSIVDSGLRRPNATGKRAIVWTVPQFKREVGDGEA
jgi:hypothetical protein